MNWKPCVVRLLLFAWQVCNQYYLRTAVGWTIGVTHIVFGREQSGIVVVHRLAVIERAIRMAMLLSERLVA